MLKLTIIVVVLVVTFGVGFRAGAIVETRTCQAIAQSPWIKC